MRHVLSASPAGTALLVLSSSLALAQTTPATPLAMRQQRLRAGLLIGGGLFCWSS